MDDRQLALQRKLGVVNHVAAIRDVVAIFDDAADLHVRQREGLGDETNPADFHDDFVEGLAVERRDGAVRPDRPRLDVVDVGEKRDVRHFDVPVLLPLLGQNLDAEVVGAEGILIVDDLMPVEDDRRGAGREVDALHRLFGGRGVAELCRCGLVPGKSVCGDRQRQQ